MWYYILPFEYIVSDHTMPIVSYHVTYDCITSHHILLCCLMSCLYKWYHLLSCYIASVDHRIGGTVLYVVISSDCTSFHILNRMVLYNIRDVVLKHITLHYTSVHYIMWYDMIWLHHRLLSGLILSYLILFIKTYIATTYRVALYYSVVRHTLSHTISRC